MAIVIAGGTKGIGLEIAEHFASKGMTLVLAYGRDHAAAQAAKTRLERVRGAKAIVLVRADVATPDGCRAIAEAAKATGEGVDVLVHSVVTTTAGALLDLDPTAFSAAIATNGASLLGLVQALLPAMTRGSSVVYLSSRGGKVVIPNYASVGVAKALAESLMRYLAVELAPRGIRINAVAPGIVDTDAVRSLFGEATTSHLEQSAKANPSGRGVVPADYTAVIDFLTSPAAAYVQGQIIYVNGGHNLMA